MFSLASAAILLQRPPGERWVPSREVEGEWVGGWVGGLNTSGLRSGGRAWWKSAAE